MIKTLILTIVALAFFPASAAGNCKDQFKRNLGEIHRRSKIMRAICWSQVQKGENNTANIMSTCNDKEIDLAYAMDTFEKRNSSLCQGSCASELNAIKVCVSGKALGYYFSKLKGP